MLHIYCARYMWNDDTIEFYKKSGESFVSLKKIAGLCSEDNLVFNDLILTREYWESFGATHVVARTLNNTYFDGKALSEAFVLLHYGDYYIPKIGKIDSDNIEVYLPKNIYAVVDDTLQIFLRSVVKAVNPYNYAVKFTCNEGIQYPRYFEVTPSKKNNSTISIDVRNNNFNVLASKNANLIISEKPTNNKEMSILCVGASTTAGAEWVNELKRRLTANDGTPKGLGLTNINFVGRLSSWGVKLEATGGWSWHTYVNPSVLSLRFIVTESSNLRVGAQLKYEVNGKYAYLKIEEINLTEGVGNIRTTFNWDTQSQELPPSSGSLTGREDDASLTYTSYTQENFSPFVNEDGNMDFTSYVNNYCNGKLDVMCIYLTAFNDGLMGEDSMEAEKNNMRKFFNALFEQYHNCKVILNTAMLGSQHGGIERIATAKGEAFTYSATTMYFNYNKAVQEIADEYSGIYIADVCGQTDSEYVFPNQDKPVNTRMIDITEKVDTNNVHPKNAGYMQFADSFYRVMIYLIDNFFFVE